MGYQPLVHNQRRLYFQKDCHILVTGRYGGGVGRRCGCGCCLDGGGGGGGGNDVIPVEASDVRGKSDDLSFSFNRKKRIVCWM